MVLAGTVVELDLVGRFRLALHAGSKCLQLRFDPPLLRPVQVRLGEQFRKRVEVPLPVISRFYEHHAPPSICSANPRPSFALPLTSARLGRWLKSDKAPLRFGALGPLRQTRARRLHNEVQPAKGPFLVVGTPDVAYGLRN